MRSTIEILITSHSGQGKFLTLIGHGSVLPNIAEDIRFKSQSGYPHNYQPTPDKALFFNL